MQTSVPTQHTHTHTQARTYQYLRKYKELHIYRYFGRFMPCHKN